MIDNAPQSAAKIFGGGITGKEIAYLCFTAIVLVLDGLFFLNFLVKHYILEAGFVDYILPLAGIVAFAALFSIAAILSSRPRVVLVIFLLASAASVLFVSVRWESFLAVALIFLSLFRGFRAIHSWNEHAASFSPAGAIKSGLTQVFTALVFLASFYYFYSQILRPPQLFSREFIHDTVGTTVEFAGEKFGTSFGGTEGLAPERLSISRSLSGLRKLLETQISESASKRDLQLEEIVDPDLPLEKRLAFAVEAQINKLLYPYRPFLPYILTFFFFFVAKSITYILYWPTLLIATAILKFFKSLGIVREEKVKIEAERTFLFF
ncbi:MAG: hypothetical protein G01um101470_378 [Parcubacteria group bacterium Gr01-1014_70]|nr:MAG: hypothetical protein G01um101470_378 [Parcubacteria group bacterium Gr01-1014_70]